MQVVILCGGRGTRLRGHFSDTPKPLVEIGGKPILWHIVKMYSHYGFNDFIFCLGYKAELIKKFFRAEKEKNWKIRFVDTGLNTNTGGRIKKIEKLICSETFFATYGDGLSDLDLRRLLRFHRHKGRIATITCVKPRSPFGIAQIDRSGQVVGFKEKPFLNQWVNGGFFVFERRIFDYLKASDILEKDSFGRLIREGQLAAYKFKGFWDCMDTYKDHLVLNELWAQGNALWAKWLKGGRK